MVLGPQSIQQNGTWYLHVLLAKVGSPLDPEDEDYTAQAIAHRTRCKTMHQSFIRRLGGGGGGGGGGGSEGAFIPPPQYNGYVYVRCTQLA